jgi:putative peptide zinc metalloprotease protein
MELALSTQNERRKQVRLKIRADLGITEQRYEGKRCYVAKDPVSLRYYRFSEQEYFVVHLFDGHHTMEDIQKEFEKEFRPQRLTHEDLEAFARQLLTAGLVQHESSRAAEELLESRRKQRRLQRIATWTNILYIKIPVFDPDRILTYMKRWMFWIFSWWFFTASVSLMISAIILVTAHYQTFYDKLPYYHEFFAFQTVLYMWISLGIVKVIHEFGHGLSCKAYGGECHEMGFLFMCFSPALFCNVSDSWTMANKWKRIIISFAGIYVELIIAALATWVWWYTPGRPFINNIALCLMTLCSISTFVFNANPLMKFDGYYILADWLEIPNLRDRSNRYLTNLFKDKAFGVEVQPEPYMAFNRRLLFVVYAVISYVYRWVVTFSIIYTISNILKPYNLGTLSKLLAVAALGSLVGWPIYRGLKGVKQRGRLPDMKSNRVTITAIIAGLIVLFVFLCPLPVSRVGDKGLVQLSPDDSQPVILQNAKGAMLKRLAVDEGDHVERNQLLAVFTSEELELDRSGAEAEGKMYLKEIDSMRQSRVQMALQEDKDQIDREIQSTYQKYLSAQKKEMSILAQIDALSVRAPQAGTVMDLPKKDEVGKYWEDTQRPICQVGNVSSLRVVMPIAPYDYELLKSDMKKLGSDAELDVSIRAPGTGWRVYHGKLQLNRLPTADAKSVPQQLTFKGGGSLAVKPEERPGMYVPQSQVYLIEINVTDADRRIVPGVIPQVKVHCRWRPLAWYVWRKINNSFDMNL